MFVKVVGVGIEPTFAAFQTAANPSQLSDQAQLSDQLVEMSVAGFEPATSGFVDQRSNSAELHGQSESGWQDSNLRKLAPKASGQPLPHILKWNR